MCLRERIVASGDTTVDRITWAMRTAMSRDPLPAEVQLLQSLYEDQLQRYRGSPEDAQRLDQRRHLTASVQC